MKEELKKAFSRFLENGGTEEEFWTWRREALAKAEARRKAHADAVTNNNRERMAHLMERGYSEFEAKEKIRLEALGAHDAMGGNPHCGRVVRCKAGSYSNVGGLAF